MRKTHWLHVVFAGLLLTQLVVTSDAFQQAYGLPVKLGASLSEVRKVLGTPNEASKPSDMSALEWYYSHGIVAKFEHDRLSSITLYKDIPFRGFIPYAGTVVNGIKVADNKATVLSKLGTPTKIENEELPEGTDPNKPERWPFESKYYWQFKDFEVQATFLNQPQSMGDEAVWPRDTLTDITVRTPEVDMEHHH